MKKKSPANPWERVIQVSFNLTIPDLALNGNFNYLSSSYPYRKYTANFTTLAFDSLKVNFEVHYAIQTNFVRC